MKILDAIRAAKTRGCSMVFQESKPWHHRGYRTHFSGDDLIADDWQVYESSYHGFRGPTEEQ